MTSEHSIPEERQRRVITKDSVLSFEPAASPSLLQMVVNKYNFDAMTPDSMKRLINFAMRSEAFGRQQDANEFMTSLQDNFPRMLEFFNKTYFESKIYVENDLLSQDEIDETISIDLYTKKGSFQNLIETPIVVDNIYYEGFEAKQVKTLHSRTNGFYVLQTLGVQTQENPGGIYLKSSAKFTFEATVTIDSISYTLVGAVVHRGETLKSGHYVAYVLRESGWYLANDRQFININKKTVFDENDHLEIKRNENERVTIEQPYMVFYKHGETSKSCHGIENFGNTCFANAVIQNLVNFL
jgi:uncharacterized UBP type Zn finger protein